MTIDFGAIVEVDRDVRVLTGLDGDLDRGEVVFVFLDVWVVRFVLLLLIVGDGMVPI